MGIESRSPESGRKHKISDRSDRIIIKRSKSGTLTKKQLSDELQAQNGQVKFRQKLYSNAQKIRVSSGEKNQETVCKREESSSPNIICSLTQRLEC